jgi:hypothetical protein
MLMGLLSLISPLLGAVGLFWLYKRGAAMSWSFDRDSGVLVVNGKPHRLVRYSGTALSDSTRTESTQVYGGGTTGTVYAPGNVSISSRTTTTDSHFVRLDDGRERNLQLVNWSIMARTGHRLGIVEKDNGELLAVANLSTEDRRTEQEQLKRWLAPVHPAIAFPLALVAGFCMFLVGIVIAIVVLVMITKRLNKLKDEIGLELHQWLAEKTQAPQQVEALPA